MPALAFWGLGANHTPWKPWRTGGHAAGGVRDADGARPNGLQSFNGLPTSMGVSFRFSAVTFGKRNMTEDIEIFANYCVFVRSIYLHARELFETSSNEDKALMKRTAGTFFGDLNRVLNEYVILQVCKITDPAHDVYNNDNHTIAFLLEHYDFSSDLPILNRLKELRASMQAFRKKIEPARHKLISHLDRATILASRPLGAATDEDWSRFRGHSGHRVSNGVA